MASSVAPTTHQTGNAIIGVLVAVLCGYSFFKKMQRKSAIIAEANAPGVPPDKSIDRGMGITTKFFANDYEKEEPPAREKVIRQSGNPSAAR